MASNIQQVIDSTRDTIRQYGASALESADFSDAAFSAEAGEYVTKANDDRLASFASDELPAQAAPSSDAQKAPDNTAGDTAPANDKNTGNDKVSDSTIDKIVQFIMGVFNMKA